MSKGAAKVGLVRLEIRLPLKAETLGNDADCFSSTSADLSDLLPFFDNYNFNFSLWPMQSPNCSIYSFFIFRLSFEAVLQRTQ